MDFYFFSDARDKWWNSRLPTDRGRRLPADRAPALPDRRRAVRARAAAPSAPRSLRRGHQEPQRPAHAAVTLRRRTPAARPVRAVDRHVVSPADPVSPAQPPRHRGALPRRAGDRRLRRARQARAARGPRRRQREDLRGRPGGRRVALRGGAAGAQRAAGGAVRRPVRGAQGDRRPARGVRPGGRPRRRAAADRQRLDGGADPPADQRPARG